VTQADGTVYVVKDCIDLPFYSRSVARFLMGRERRLMRRLEGLTGFPVVRARIDRNAFAMGVLEGTPLTPEAFRLAPRRIADGLLERIAAMHDRGVYHLDLRQRQNILLGEGLEVRILDFGAGWAPNPLARWCFAKLLGEVDRSAALKYLARFSPEDLTREEALEVLRGLRRRKLWILSPYRGRGVEEAVRERLAEANSSTQDG
jgi:RIO-like serine/threonine protein kinase